MIVDGRKYVVNDNAGIFCDITKVPDTLLVPGDDYIQTGGLAVGMRINLADTDVPVTLCMTQDDTKALIKALKMTVKKHRRLAKTKL